ncbi:MAG TPA: ParA family protein [Candidatus Binataceae bacterium]|nr:ParA family protein [Candidatus Binataceae bacterium]
MGRLVVIANQKGGVGKTTTAINLAVALAQTSSARSEMPILLVDLDPQGNATSGLIPPAELSQIKASGKTIYEAIVGRIELPAAIRKVRDNIDLAPSGSDLVGAEVELAGIEGRERCLKRLLVPLASQYSYVLVDTPPSLGLLTLNAMVAADSILVPMQCEYYALEGLSALLGTITRVRKVLNPALEIDGIVLTMFDSRNRLSHEIARDVSHHFPDKLFQAVIPRNVRLSESPSHGLSVLEYDGKSAGAEAYRALAAEVVKRAENGAQHEAEPSVEQESRSWSLRNLLRKVGGTPAPR